MKKKILSMKGMCFVRRKTLWLKHRLMRMGKVESDMRRALSNIGSPNEKELGLLVMQSFLDFRLMAILTRTALLRIRCRGVPRRNQVHKALIVLHKLSIESTWAKDEMRTDIPTILKFSFYSGRSKHAQEIRALAAAILRVLLNIKTSETEITEFFSCISTGTGYV
jgi:hypothetical protein